MRCPCEARDDYAERHTTRTKNTRAVGRNWLELTVGARSRTINTRMYYHAVYTPVPYMLAAKPVHKFGKFEPVACCSFSISCLLAMADFPISRYTSTSNPPQARAHAWSFCFVARR